MEFGSFCGGSLIGALYGAIIVYVFWQMAELRKKIAYASNPYDKFPDALQPTLTAVGVTRGSRNARFTRTLLVLFLAVFIPSYPIVIYILFA